MASLAWSAREGRLTRGLGAGGDPLKEQDQDNPFRLVVVELFLPRAERERGERKRDARIAVHTQRQREKEREGGKRGRTRDARNALRGGGKRRKEEKEDAARTDGRTNAVFTSQRIIPRRVRPRRIAIVGEISPRVTRPSTRANPVRSGRSTARSFASVSSLLFFFSFPSLRRVSRDVRASVSLPLPCARALPPFFALADARSCSLCLCLSLSPGRSVR